MNRGLIRILDLTFIRKDSDGSVTGLEIGDPTGDGQLDLAVFEGASSGPLGQDDLEEAAAALEPGNSAGVPSTRTSGPRRSPPPCDAAVPSWSPPEESRCPRFWPRSTRPRPRPEEQGEARREIAMPGLIRDDARTAVVAGTATAVSNRVSRRQQGRWAAQQEYRPPAPQSAPPAGRSAPAASDMTGSDVAALARQAADEGADLLGVAGGDGTQALVAGVAAERGLPFLVIAAGTRNHFACACPAAVLGERPTGQRRIVVGGFFQQVETWGTAVVTGGARVAVAVSR